jgi:predicted DNA-binding protein YlxM (UPF0122 family)
MDKKNLFKKKTECETLYLTGKYTHKEIAEKLEISEQSIGEWIKNIPATRYYKIRANLSKELERLSINPQGNEELIFKYISNLDILDTMIRKAKFLPKI